MATHVTSETASTPAERKLLFLTEHGDDFLKIELLRPALRYYERALELDPDNLEIKRKIAKCKMLLIIEMRAIWILAAIGGILVVMFLLL
ncbi:MAG TPA: tetratricopeptide repeat protein [Prolixibacteraceae bacterium]|nr:tetratricopeptide repeat protein [Prolixibacteraceae bacterium]